MHIYVIKNTINSKYYVGKSEKEPNDNYLGSGKAITRAVKKYGKENFEKSIIIKDIKDIHILNKFEKMYIRLFKIKFQENCYNIAEGGDGGNNHKYKSEQEKKDFSEKMSKANKGHTHNRGRTHSKEVNALKGSPGEKNGMFGKKHPPERIDKISKQISLSKTIKCICEHCGKEADKGNYNRWHSDNCKFNPYITEQQLLRREPWNKMKI